MMRTLADGVAALQVGARAGEADSLPGLVRCLETDALALLVPSAAVSVSLGRLRDAARASAGTTAAAGRTERLAVFEAALYRLAMAAERVALDEGRAAARPGFDRSAVPNPVVRAT